MKQYGIVAVSGRTSSSRSSMDARLLDLRQHPDFAVLYRGNRDAVAANNPVTKHGRDPLDEVRIPARFRGSHAEILRYCPSAPCGA